MPLFQEGRGRKGSSILGSQARDQIRGYQYLCRAWARAAPGLRLSAGQALGDWVQWKMHMLWSESKRGLGRPRKSFAV